VTEQSPFWYDDDASWWISAEDQPDARKAGEALMDMASMFMGDNDSLVCEGRKSVSLRDCPLDDCEGHPNADGTYDDCPEFVRDVWEFSSMSGGGLAWPDIEEAIAKGRVVILHEDYVERGGQVHWRDRCECHRCETLDVLGPDNDAPSIPMFEEAPQ
jgi:hypothetical protein